MNEQVQSLVSFEKTEKAVKAAQAAAEIGFAVNFN